MERSLNRNEIGCRRYRKKSIRASSHQTNKKLYN
jgi:hypothetical protein